MKLKGIEPLLIREDQVEDLDRAFRELRDKKEGVSAINIDMSQTPTSSSDHEETQGALLRIVDFLRRKRSSQKSSRPHRMYFRIKNFSEEQLELGLHIDLKI